MSDNEQAHTTLAAFTVDNGNSARRLLKAIQRIDEANDNVKIVDAAVVDRGRFGRISVHQTTDRGALKTGVRVGTLGVIVGAIVAGPAGAVAMGAAGGVLGGLRGGIHDTGIDDKFMRSVGKEIEKKKSAVFVLYEGSWEHSIGLVEQAITDEHAVLFNSTLTAEKAAALQALVDPAVEAVGGEEVAADYELEVEEAPAAAPEEAPAPVAEAAAVAAVAAAPAEAKADDLTQLVGVGPKASAALATAGITTYAALSEVNEPQLRRALHDADMAPPANVGTWPMQASPRVQGRLAGPDEVQQPGRQVTTRPPAGGGGRRRAVRRPDPAQRHRAADRVDPQRRRDHELQPAPAREHRRAAPDHRHRRCAAAREPRILAHPGHVCGQG